LRARLETSPLAADGNVARQSRTLCVVPRESFCGGLVGLRAVYIQNIFTHIEGFAGFAVHFGVGNKAVFCVKTDYTFVVLNVGINRDKAAGKVGFVGTISDFQCELYHI
jgi:hypothetical protein